jgi:ribosomal protein S18 acetylase RimI-like enzyme
MVTYRKATVKQRAEFLALLREESDGSLEPTLRIMGTTWKAFSEAVWTVGEVRSILRGRTTVGFVWIERRDRTLHVHGLAPKAAFRGQGIGTTVFHDLEREFQGTADTVELGVHEVNPRARALCERLGFRVEETLPEVGFVVLRKPLGAASA